MRLVKSLFQKVCIPISVISNHFTKLVIEITGIGMLRDINQLVRRPLFEEEF